MKYTHPVSEEVVNKTIEALTKNGISAELVQTAEEAKNKVLSLIPEGAEVMTMTSRNSILHQNTSRFAINSPR